MGRAPDNECSHCHKSFDDLEEDQDIYVLTVKQKGKKGSQVRRRFDSWACVQEYVARSPVAPVRGKY